MDVSQGGLAVSSDTQGNVNIWTTNNGEVRVRNQLNKRYIFWLFKHLRSFDLKVLF